MPNMQKEKTPMPHQDPAERAKNFKEVALGYTKEQAKNEAERCLNCKNKPCVQGCPVSVRIPEFIQKICDDDVAGAYEVLKSTNALPAICGRVCPQENQCEKFCVRGIKNEPVAIGRLERYAADTAMAEGVISSDRAPANGRRVAVIGSGPSGLTCASDLAKLGYSVTIFEALHIAGGVLSYGIPEFRLPKKLVKSEIDALLDLGVELKTNFIAGKSATIDDLMSDGYEAVFIGSGAGLPSFMGIPGENLNGVYSANEFLTRINLMKAYQFPEADTPVSISGNVAVIGGGNVAMDAARSALRLGADNVYIVYRRAMEQMPARAEEIEHAKQEGVQFHILEGPAEVLGDEKGSVCGLKCVKMELGEPDESGRRRPRRIEGSEHVLDVGTVIVAIGQSPNPLIRSTTKGLACKDFGGIATDENGATTREYVYAGGDAVTGAATVILAMGAGKAAAAAIHRKLSEK